MQERHRRAAGRHVAGAWSDRVGRRFVYTCSGSCLIGAGYADLPARELTSLNCSCTAWCSHSASCFVPVMLSSDRAGHAAGSCPAARWVGFMNICQGARRFPAGDESVLGRAARRGSSRGAMTPDAARAHDAMDDRRHSACWPRWCCGAGCRRTWGEGKFGTAKTNVARRQFSRRRQSRAFSNPRHGDRFLRRVHWTGRPRHRRQFPDAANHAGQGIDQRTDRPPRPAARHS